MLAAHPGRSEELQADPQALQALALQRDAGLAQTLQNFAKLVSLAEASLADSENASEQTRVLGILQQFNAVCANAEAPAPEPAAASASKRPRKIKIAPSSLPPASTGATADGDGDTATADLDKDGEAANGDQGGGGRYKLSRLKSAVWQRRVAKAEGAGADEETLATLRATRDKWVAHDQVCCSIQMHAVKLGTGITSIRFSFSRLLPPADERRLARVLPGECAMQNRTRTRTKTATISTMVHSFLAVAEFCVCLIETSIVIVFRPV